MCGIRGIQNKQDLTSKQNALGINGALQTPKRLGYFAGWKDWGAVMAHPLRSQSLIM